MALLGFAALMGAFFYYEYARIRRYGGGQREQVAFSVVMLLALLFGSAMILGLPIPNPTDLIEAIFHPVAIKLVPPS